MHYSSVSFCLVVRQQTLASDQNPNGHICRADAVQVKWHRKLYADAFQPKILRRNSCGGGKRYQNFIRFASKRGQVIGPGK
jgi:hypothetical protein